jgi:hypothetical protein
MLVVTTRRTDHLVMPVSPGAFRERKKTGPVPGKRSIDQTNMKSK